MTILTILAYMLGFALFVFIGFALWQYGRENYGFNIYGLGTVIRGLTSYVALYFAVMIHTPDDRLVLLIVAAVLWLWTFVLTLIRTNILIAVLALIYQAIAAIGFYFLLNQAVRIFYGVKGKF